MRAVLGIVAVLAFAGGQAMADVVELQDFDKLWDYADPAATEATFRALLPEAASRGADYHAQLLTQIARTKGLRGDFDAAFGILSQAHDLLTRESVIARIRYHVELGRTYNSSGDKKKACFHFEEAMTLADEAKAEFHMVDAAHMMGIATEGERALEWNLAAIKLAEAAKSEKARGWLGPLYNNTGWTYHDKKDYDKALAFFLKSLAFRKERKQTKETRIAKWTVARCLRSMGRYEEALANQRALLEEYEQEDHRDGFVYEEIGENLWALGNKRESRSWFRGAYELLSEVDWLVRSEPERIASLKERGQVQDAPEDPLPKEGGR